MCKMQTVQQRDANGMLVCPVEPTLEAPPPRTLALKVMDGALASLPGGLSDSHCLLEDLGRPGSHNSI